MESKKTNTLSDADITSQRTISRRSLLGTAAIGAGAAAAATFGMTTAAHARDLPDNPRRCSPARDGRYGMCYDTGSNQD